MKPPPRICFASLSKVLCVFFPCVVIAYGNWWENEVPSNYHTKHMLKKPHMSATSLRFRIFWAVNPLPIASIIVAIGIMHLVSVWGNLRWLASLNRRVDGWFLRQIWLGCWETAGQQVKAWNQLKSSIQTVILWTSPCLDQWYICLNGRKP